MTPKERAVAALTLRIPDMVPTFELEFQLDEEMFGEKLITEEYSTGNLAKFSAKEKEKMVYRLAERWFRAFSNLEYSIIPCAYLGDFESCGPCDIPKETKLFIKYMRQIVEDKYMLHFHGDGTFAVPDGDEMCTCISLWVYISFKACVGS
jgi:uroporphyrinogen decarboxylase